MWLVYLRFDDQGAVRTYHVTVANERAVKELYALAEQHGLTETEQLVEYAFLYTRGTVKPKQVPNFHFYKGEDFTRRWNSVSQ